MLTDAGYRIAKRTDGWVEYLVQRESERWIGHGHSDEEALDDALRKMFPSHLARMLFDRHVAAHASAEASPVVAAEPVAQDVPVLDPAPVPALEETALPVLPVFAPAAVVEPEAPVIEPLVASLAPAPAAPLPVAAPEPPVERPAPAPDAIAPLAVARYSETTPDAPLLPHHVAPANEAAAERSFRARAADTLDSVERLLQTIEARLPALARMSADRQRLHMMVWICRARAAEEALPDVREIEHAVARVARRLTDIGKMFWPGSVRALQLSARPADVRREMHATWASEPANWESAASLAQRLLDEHLAKSADAGLDEDGWADAAARTPKPSDPDALLAEVDAELRAMLIPQGEVPNGRLPELSMTEFDALLNTARKLRWTRGLVQDDLAWGVAMGRLRRALPALGERSARIRDVLDHRLKPQVPWAKALGQGDDEPAAAAAEASATLVAELPTARETKDGLLAWLIRAFDVLNTPDLVALLVPLKADLLAFGEDTLNHSDRRVRRRLRELVRRVASATEVSVSPPPASTRSIEPEEAPTEDALAPHALDTLSARVRKQTEGSRALFVSNRDDPELGAKLSDLLGITITWCDGSLRRVQAQCERIARGSYDLVLSATGFQVHGVDSALAKAASASGVPYVRVNRGRPVACVQAIAREFGLTSGTFPIGNGKVSSADSG